MEPDKRLPHTSERMDSMLIQVTIKQIKQNSFCSLFRIFINLYIN